MNNWLTGLVVAVLLFGWAISGLSTLNLNSRVQRSGTRFVHPDFILVSLALVLGGVGAIGIFAGNFSWSGLLQTIAPELLSISVTILVLDRLNEYRSGLREKQQIIAQMASQSNDAALEAARRARLHGWFFDGSLIGCHLAWANLRSVDFSHAELQRAQCTKASLQHANLSHTNLSQARLSHADLRKAHFHETQLTGANFMFANLGGTYIYDSDLSHAKLIFVDLSDSELPMTSLIEADLEDANLEGTDLRYANMRGAKLSGAIYNSRTRWPEGFLIPTDTQNTDNMESEIVERLRQFRDEMSVKMGWQPNSE